MPARKCLPASSSGAFDRPETADSAARSCRAFRAPGCVRLERNRRTSQCRCADSESDPHPGGLAGLLRLVPWRRRLGHTPRWSLGRKNDSDGLPCFASLCDEIKLAGLAIQQPDAQAPISRIEEDRLLFRNRYRRTVYRNALHLKRAAVSVADDEENARRLALDLSSQPAALLSNHPRGRGLCRTHRRSLSR